MKTSYDLHRQPFVKRFYEKWLPGVTPGVAGASSKQSKFLASASVEEARFLSDTLLPDSVKDFGNRGFEDFEREHLQRVRELWKIGGRHSQSRIRPWAAYWYGRMPLGSPFAEKLRNVQLNLRHFESILAGVPTEKVGDFRIESGLCPHLEAIMGFNVHDKNGEHVAGVGFRLFQKPDGRTMIVIDNIQGKPGRKQEIEALNKALGGNWAKHLVRRVIAHAKRHGFEVGGETPERERIFGTSQERYARIKHLHELTFRALGFRKEGEQWLLRKKG